MRYLLCLFLIIVTVCSIAADEVQGDTLTINGEKVLKVWGSHQERGYAYGYLMSEQIKTVILDYFLGSYFYNNTILYNTFTGYVTDYFTIEEKYEQEFEGIINGMLDSGCDPYSPVLDRNIGTEDLLICNSVTDLAGFLSSLGIPSLGCSSMSSWGNSTIDDPQLLGDLVITRNMDWVASPILMENHLMVINFPEEENEIPWLSICFPGMIGTLSGINSGGTASFLNVGNVNNSSNPENLHPIFLSIRNGLETLDYNGDNETDMWDIWDAVNDKTHFGSSITHCVTNPASFIIEVNHENGAVIRDFTDNQNIAGENLVATNHFRSLYNPIYCHRYEAFIDSLEFSDIMNAERSWDVSAGAAGVSNNLHTIQYLPSLNILKWSTADIGIPAYQQEPAQFDLVSLFEQPVETDNIELPDHKNLIHIYPNPSEDHIIIEIIDCKRGSNKAAVYNIKGQLMTSFSFDGNRSINWDLTDSNGRKVSNGVYIIEIFNNSDLISTKRFITIK